MLAVDQRTVTRYQKRAEDPLPVAVRGKRGTANAYDANAVLEWAVRQRLADLSVGDDGSVYNYDAERARLTHHQANKTALEEQQLDGILVSADQVEQQWSALFTALRSRLLGMPVRLAQTCISSGHTLREVEDAARNEIYQALGELIQDASQQILPAPDDSVAEPGEVAPAAEADSR